MAVQRSEIVTVLPWLRALGFRGMAVLTTAMAVTACSGSANGGSTDAGNSQLDAGPPSLTGSWALRANMTNGVYTADMALSQDGGALTGSIGSWEAVALDAALVLGTTFTGSVDGSSITLNRTDSSGFRTTFVGTASQDGKSMSGTAANDPTSPGGNNATGTWTAQRQ
jgi:hypothetical protein